MHAVTSPLMTHDRPAKTPSNTHQRRQWSIGAWIAVLAAVNLPLLSGKVRMGLLFLPDAVGMGQWWRIITYPLVHLSWYHLLLDAGGFLLLYTCMEENRILAKALYIVGASAGSLLLSLAMDPSISQQGLSGLSGIAHGLMAITALEMLRHKDQRTWGLISLSVVVAKSAYELWTGQVLFEFMHMGLCGLPMATSHAGGVMGGLLAFILVTSWTTVFSRTLPPRKKAAIHPRTRDDDRRITKSRQSSTAQALLRLIAITITRILYRVRYEGIARIPSKGPAVLVCNHVSYVDWLIIASACDRPVHFVMHAAIYRQPVLRWFFRMAKVIPIDSGRKNPALLRRAFKEMAEVLHTGGLICIFPEGHLTRTGQIGRFRPGIETIIRQTPVPVVPLALRGLWGSFFSHKNGLAMRCRPLKIWTRVEVAVGIGIPAHQVSARHLQCAVQTLRGDST
jgi:rhomboid family GlyGly-CTERM serine protease